MKRAVLALGVVLFVAAFSLNVWAQATAQISGSVRDQSSAVLPGVEITATAIASSMRAVTIQAPLGCMMRHMILRASSVEKEHAGCQPSNGAPAVKARLRDRERSQCFDLA